MNDIIFVYYYYIIVLGLCKIFNDNDDKIYSNMM
jgi:hypothetical protein